MSLRHAFAYRLLEVVARRHDVVVGGGAHASALDGLFGGLFVGRSVGGRSGRFAVDVSGRMVLDAGRRLLFADIHLVGLFHQRGALGFLDRGALSLLRGGKLGFINPSLLDPRLLPAEVAQVIQLGATDTASLDDLQLRDRRRVEREGSFDPDPEGDLADRERLADAAARAPDDDALEDLHALAVALHDADMHLDGVAGAEIREIGAQERLLDHVGTVHGTVRDCTSDPSPTGARERCCGWMSAPSRIRGTSSGTLAPPGLRADDARMSEATIEGQPATPARPDARRRLAGTWAGVAVAIVFGLLTDAAVRVPPGLALTLGTWLAAIAIAWFARAHAKAWPFLVGAIALGTCFVLRTSPVLVILDLLGATALLCVGASFARDGTPGRTTTRSYLVRAAATPFESLPDGVSSLVGPPARELSGRASPRAIARAALLIVPITATLAILLGSADPVFRHYVHAPSIEPTIWPAHVVATLVGALALATLVAIALRSPTVGDATMQRPLSARWARTGEWVGLLVSVDVLFAIFVVIQFAVLFGGRTHVLEAEGLTYAQYARGGFWQLVAAAAIAGSAIVFAWHALPRPAPRGHRRVFLMLGITLIALVGVVLVSALRRLMLYEDAYGLTYLRILVQTTIIALGAMFACVVVALVRWRVSWLPAAAVAIVTVAVLSLNVANIDARIASSNIDRAIAGHPVDTRTLALLSPDAVPVMVRSLDSLPAGDRADVARVLACDADDLVAGAPPGWAGANRSRAAAADALATVPLPAC
jgi:Domain of unknown function (DUF4153)